MTGNDAVMGRIRHVQGAIQVVIDALLMIMGNVPLGAYDPSGALRRRMRVFYAPNVSHQHIPLLVYKHGKWSGPLSEELSGIFNWLLTVTGDTVRSYLVDMRTMVPSLEGQCLDTQRRLNPLPTWAREELQIGEGSCVGGRVPRDRQAWLEAAKRGLLYPAYEACMRRNGVKPILAIDFADDLIQTLNASDLGYAVRRDNRKKRGNYLIGVELRPGVYDADNRYGASLSEPEPLIEVEALTATSTAQTEALIEVEALTAATTAQTEPLLETEVVAAASTKNVSARFVEHLTEALEALPDDEEEVVAAESTEDRDAPFVPDPMLTKPLRKREVVAAERAAQASAPSTDAESAPAPAKQAKLFTRCAVHKALEPELYHNDFNQLKETPLKLELHSVLAELVKQDEDEQEVLETALSWFFEDVAGRRPNFRDSEAQVTKVMLKFVRQIAHYSGIRFEYKMAGAGASPRIIPAACVDTIYYAETIVRACCYYQLTHHVFEQHQMVVLDVDLMSCDSSMVLGLSPKPLQALQSAAEGPGLLWSSIEAQMEANERGAAYHQPAVQIATRGSLLLNDRPALMSLLFNNLRQEHGVTESELKNSAYYESYRRCFEDIVDAVMSSSVIKDMREVSQHIKDTYHNKYLHCPTGHSYLVNDVSFPTAYANYLHSYWFALLAEAACDTL